MELYGIATCDTCRKALRALREAGAEVSFRDIRKAPLTDEEIATVLDRFGGEAVNRRSTTWRGLDDAARASPEADLIRAHPTLLKRPVIRDGATWHLGWGREVQAALVPGTSDSATK